MKKAIIASIVLALSGTAFASQIQCINKIDSFSNKEKMMKKDFSPNVLFKDVNLTKNSIGYGPGQYRENELTIVDGIVYFAHPDKNGDVVFRDTQRENEGAPMLQVSTPKSWELYEEIEDVNSLNDISFIFEDLTEDLGCNGKVTLPFKLKGKVKNVTWSLDTLPKHKIDTSYNQDIEVVGIYDTITKKKTFMVKGTDLHAHVLIKKLKIAGHIREIEFTGKVKLYLPNN